MSTRAQRREAAKLMPAEWHAWRRKATAHLIGRLIAIFIAGAAIGRLVAVYGWESALLALCTLSACTGFVLLREPPFQVVVDYRDAAAERDRVRDTGDTT